MSAAFVAAAEAQHFQNNFLNASSAARAQLIINVAARNLHNSQIINMLQNININDTAPQNRMKVDSIYFACQQLRAFPDFKC